MTAAVDGFTIHRLGSDSLVGRVRPAITGLYQSIVFGRVPRMVAPFVIRRRFCSITVTVRHRSADHRRSGTLCVLRLAFYFNWVLSAQLRNCSNEEGSSPAAPDRLFDVGSTSHQRDYGMRCQPSGHPVFLKRVHLPKPCKSLFSKRASESLDFLIRLYMYKAQRQLAIIPKLGKQKTHLVRTEMRCFLS